MKPRIMVYDSEEGGHWAKVPSLPGLFTQGETLEELEANLREAIELYLSEDPDCAAGDRERNGRVLEIAV